MNPRYTVEHPVLSPELRAKAEALIGSAGMGSENPDEWLAELSIEELREVDSIVFNCEGCNWWCSADECNEDDGWYCDDCMKDRGHDDEGAGKE